MKVLKFGGTSVGTADRMQEVVDIIEKNKGSHLVVLSAMSGTTNDLVAICRSIKNEELDTAITLVEDLSAKYNRVLTDLLVKKERRDKARNSIEENFNLIEQSISSRQFTHKEEKIILAQGELISTSLFQNLCEERGLNSVLIPALEFMRLQANGEPDLKETSALLNPIIRHLDEELDVVITQGYICRNHSGEIDNLRRGGSDYTATILGACLEAEEVQIWTDIDGIHNNDPRVVANTKPVRHLSYREAAELAYFGAKILHPTCVLPVEKVGVPLRLKYTMKPSAPGTLISAKSSGKAITAIAAKDGIAAINIHSDRMLQAYGFLKQVFSVFEIHMTPVDMITTSEVAVSVTVDQTEYLDNILNDLQSFSEVSVDYDYSIICAVGNELFQENRQVRAIFDCLTGIPLRMVSMGGSKNNISLLVKTESKEIALKALNTLFEQSWELEKLLEKH